MDRNNVEKYDENGLFSCGISSPASSFAKVWVDDRSINHKEKKNCIKKFENSTVDKKFSSYINKLLIFNMNWQKL